LKLNGTHQLLVYTDDVNILGGGVHTVKKKQKPLWFLARELDQKKMLMKLST
jgi:hypothetical protein